MAVRAAGGRFRVYEKDVREQPRTANQRKERAAHLGLRFFWISYSNSGYGMVVTKHSEGEAAVFWRLESCVNS